MQTGRRGRVLETAGLLRAAIHNQARRRTTTIGHRLHRQMAAEATRMAVTQMGTARISRLHDRVRRPEAITRMPRRTTAVAAGLMRRPRILIRHRAAVTRRRRDPTRRRLLALIRHRHHVRTRRLRIRLPAVRTQPQAVVTLLQAAVMVAVEVGVTAAAAAARMEVAAEAPRMEAEAALEAVADRTDTDQQNNIFSPLGNWAGFFSPECLATPLSQLLGVAGVYLNMVDRAFPDWTSGKCPMERGSV
jgi:hypothetical protein